MWYRVTVTIRWLCLFLCGFAAAFDPSAQRICAASLVSQVEPVYPDAAKRKGIRGTVRLDVVVGKDGRVMRVDLINGNSVLVEAAKRAVMQWVFKPTLLNGEPIEVVLEVQVTLPRSNSPQRPTPTRCG